MYACFHLCYVNDQGFNWSIGHHFMAQWKEFEIALFKYTLLGEKTCCEDC